MTRFVCIVVLQACLNGLTVGPLAAQNNDEGLPAVYRETARAIINAALGDGQAYAMLEELCLQIGPRLSGSPEAAAAVEWSRNKMVEVGLEGVRLQPVMVPHWVRGPVESALVLNSESAGSVQLEVCALGGTIGTPEFGVIGEVIEVQNFEEVKALGKSAQGKIIFYNRALDRTLMTTFKAYGGAVDQRSRGAIEAAKVGAKAVLVRSMTTALDDVPHTGAMRYDDGVEKIPSAAISTIDADFLSRLLKQDQKVRLRLTLSAKTFADAPSANVLGEIRGSEKPEEVIVLGGHLDSWDKGHGAHDDGAGCMQSIEALRLLKSLDLKPKRTIRAVMFMNEENGVRGGLAYADSAGRSSEKHILAIESDRGGFTPRGFSVTAESAQFESIARWAGLLEAMAADKIVPGYGGVDINPLNKQFGVPVMGLVVDAHRYFDYHHSDNDTIDKVNERELELGAAAMAIISYVVAMEGI